MAGLVEYKIRCLTEGRVVRGYTSGLLVPRCPNGSNHIVETSTLIKIAEIAAPAETPVEFVQTTTYQVEAVEDSSGTTGVTVPFTVSGRVTSLTYPPQTSPGRLTAEYAGPGGTGIYLNSVQLRSSGGSINLDIPIPPNTTNRFVYTPEVGASRVFNFTATYTY